MPTVSSRPVSWASRSLVPTPSVEVTSTGSCRPVGQLEHAGEAADGTQHPGDVGALRVGLDEPDGLFSRLDVHAGLPVGEVHRVLGVDGEHVVGLIEQAPPPRSRPRAAPVELVPGALASGRSRPARPSGRRCGASAVVVVVVVPSASESDGNWTGLTNTMMQTRTTRQAPAMPSSLRLRSTAPTRAARKKPLKRKNNTMLTELLTRPAYQTARD